MTEQPPEETTEGGFGTGLRAQLSARAAVAEAAEKEAPRSPAEAVAAVAPPPPAGDTDVEELRAELDASLARELELRTSLDDRLESSAREAQLDQRALQFAQRETQLEQEVARRMAELEDRAGALAAHESELRAQETRLDQRLGEFDELHAELQRAQAELDAAAARVSQREQAVVLKVRELTMADEQRAAAAADLTQQIEGIAERERLLAKAEAGTLARREELAKEAEKLDQLGAERERGFDAAEHDLVERRKLIEAAERALTAAQAEMTKKNDELAKRVVAQEQEHARMHGLSQELEREQARVQAQRAQVDALRAEAESSRATVPSPRGEELDRREMEIAAREAEVHRLEAALRRAEAEMQLARSAPPPVDEVAQKRVQERERALAEREARLEKLEALADASRQRLEEKEQKVDTRDEELRMLVQQPRRARRGARPARGADDRRARGARAAARGARAPVRRARRAAHVAGVRPSDVRGRAPGPVRQRGRLVGEAARHEAGGFCRLTEGGVMVRTRSLVSVAAAVALLGCAAAAAAGAGAGNGRTAIRFAFVPQRAYQGLPAAVSVLVKPDGVQCNLAVRYVDGSLQPGLGSVRASVGTRCVDVEPRAGRAGRLGPCFGRVRAGRQRRARVHGRRRHGRALEADDRRAGVHAAPRPFDAGSSVSYGVVLHNPSASADAQNVTVLVNFVDEGNHVVESATTHVSSIAAASSFNLGGSASLPSQTPVAKLEVVVQTEKFAAHAAHIPPAQNVQIVGSTYDPGYVGEVDGELVNDDATKVLTSAQLSVVLFDAAGAVVGGGTGFVFASLPPGTRSYFSASSGFSDVLVDHASVAAISVVPSYQSP